MKIEHLREFLILEKTRNFSEAAIVWKQSSFAQAALCRPTIQYSYTLFS